MSALAVAMLLTGAGAVQAAKPPPPRLPPIIMPAPPAPYRVNPSPPSPPRTIPPQRARANLNSYFSTDDYPALAVAAQEQGTVRFQLTIGSNGRVSACEVVASSGSAALDAATCRILHARARYTPARALDGTPIAGRDSGRVTWRLPDADPDGARAFIPVPSTRAVLRGQAHEHFAASDYPVSALRGRESGQTIIRLVVGTTGRVIACDVAVSSRSVALDAAACRIMRERVRYAPARAASGAAACDVFWNTVEWVLPPPRRPLPRDGPSAVVPPPIEEQLAPGACPGRTP